MPQTTRSDRYVSFQGIDCEGNARAVTERILMHIADPAAGNPFWDHFKRRLAEAGNDPRARTADGLCLLCSIVYAIDELFEDRDDAEGLRLLRRLEEECC